jgi:hypothetical protein
MQGFRKIAITAFISSVLLCSVQATAEMVPDFGPSVKFDKNDLAFRMSDLRGKMVLLIFFQSWCPICNGWSADMFKQVETTYGSDPEVALVAIKSDAKDIAEVKTYLGIRTDTKKWLLAADIDGVYEFAVMGENKLYKYAIISPKGEITQKNDASRYYTGQAKKAFVVADASLKKDFGQGTKAVLPAGKQYPDNLRTAVKAAEAGSFVVALNECTKQNKVKEADDLKADILSAVNARVDDRIATVKSAEAQGRFDAYMLLRDIAIQLKPIEAGKKALDALKEVEKDAAIKKELAAERQYLALMDWAGKLGKTEKEKQLPPALKTFLQQFDGTFYAKRAQQQLSRMGQW